MANACHHCGLTITSADGILLEGTVDRWLHPYCLEEYVKAITEEREWKALLLRMAGGRARRLPEAAR